MFLLFCGQSNIFARKKSNISESLFKNIHEIISFRLSGDIVAPCEVHSGACVPKQGVAKAPKPTLRSEGQAGLTRSLSGRQGRKLVKPSEAQVKMYERMKLIFLNGL
jgi:hypothetical protein